MPIIPNIATVKKFLSVNYTNSVASLPPMRKAETELRRVLGTTLFNTVQTAITGNAPTELTELCQDYVCHYAYWLHLPDMMVQIGEAGLSVKNTENNGQPFKWQYREKRAALAGKAMLALDDLITYLLITPGGWVKPALYTGRSIATGIAFSAHYPLRNPEAVFLQLLPIMEQVEAATIHTAIGKDFYEALLTANDVAMGFIRRAVAAFTIRDAVSRLSCQLTPDGFTVLMDPADDPRSGQQSAPANLLSATAHSADVAGQGALHELKKFLNNNAGATGPYALYYNSTHYQDPNLKIVSPNACRQGVFGM